MSTAKRKQNESPSYPYNTDTGQIVRIERATEAMAHYIGFLLREAMKEEEQPLPNAAKIKALRTQQAIVSNEKHAIRSDNEELIDKAMYIYAPIIKAL